MQLAVCRPDEPLRQRMGSSYYDNIGLLAICDAIDTLEGVNFRPLGAPRGPPASLSGHSTVNVPLPGPYPPLAVGSAAKSTYPQHPYLNHAPPSATISSSGTMSYSQAQRAAYAQFNSSSAQTARALPAARPPRADTPDRYGYRGAPPVAAPGSATSAVPSPRPVSHPAASPSSTSPSPSPQGTGQRHEECHVCGRSFRGPKASTHKQQHIRRLHPNEYTPKRGGKKRAP